MKILFAVLVLGGLARANPGLPEECKGVLETANSAVLYSLEPWGTRAKDVRHFYVYEILGKTTLDAKDTRLAAAEFENDAVLKKKLLAHTLKSSDQDKRERAKNAFR